MKNLTLLFLFAFSFNIFADTDIELITGSKFKGKIKKLTSRFVIVDTKIGELKLTKHQVETLLIFLRSLTGENLAEGPVQSHNRLKNWKNKKRPEVAVSIESGEKIFNDFGCSACHRVNGIGQLVAPELSYVGLQRTKEWLIQHFLNPRSLVAGSLMPDFSFSKTELDAITMYLMSLKGEEKTDSEDIDKSGDKK